MNTNKKEKPMFKHNCEYCEFLGNYKIYKTYNPYGNSEALKDKSNDFYKYDLYYCVKGNGNLPTVVARFGNEPQDYISGPDGYTMHAQVILEGWRRHHCGH